MVYVLLWGPVKVAVEGSAIMRLAAIAPLSIASRFYDCCKQL